jgi:hypothetical protein
MRYIVLILLFTVPACAADSATPEDQERLKRVSAEVQRRRLLREKEENARRVVREHESGARTATKAELDAARAIVREDDARKAKEGTAKSKTDAVAPGGLNDGEEIVSARLLDADVQTVLMAYSIWTKEKVDAPPEVMRLRTSLRFDNIKKSDAILRVQRALLEQARVEIVRREDGSLLARKAETGEK